MKCFGRTRLKKQHGIFGLSFGSTHAFATVSLSFVGQLMLKSNLTYLSKGHALAMICFQKVLFSIFLSYWFIVDLKWCWEKISHFFFDDAMLAMHLSWDELFQRIKKEIRWMEKSCNCCARSFSPPILVQIIGMYFEENM